MLHALVATMGALAVLASVAAKLARLPADVAADDVAAGSAAASTRRSHCHQLDRRSRAGRPARR
jgi:hypothetical protein